MTEDRHVLREIAWQEVFPGLMLFSAWKIAISLRALVLASLGVLATSLGWMLVDYVFEVPKQQSIVNAWLPALPSFQPGVVHDRAANEPTSFIPLESKDFRIDRQQPTDGPGAWWIANPIVDAWSSLTLPFKYAFATGLSGSQFGYFSACALWALVVWSYFGGAITRLAAVQLTRDEKLSWGQTLGYARSKWPS